MIVNLYFKVCHLQSLVIVNMLSKLLTSELGWAVVVRQPARNWSEKGKDQARTSLCPLTHDTFSFCFILLTYNTTGSSTRSLGFQPS